MENRVKKTNLSGSVNKADRISNLPISLIHHILSYLPADYMVQTCLLSKNWRNIWFSAPSLDFDNSVFIVEQPNADCVSFEQFVDFLLLTRSGCNIQNFSLSIEPEFVDSEAENEVENVAKGDLSPSKINAWIGYALRHNVEVIEVKSYMSLTPLLFSCESLRELKITLNGFDIDSPSSLSLPSSVNLPSLRVLHLVKVLIQAGQLDDALFSAMPCLETLNIEHCKFSLKKLSIESTYKLQTLLMTGNFLAHFELSISAPNLKFLKVDARYDTIKAIRFRNDCVKLINANIGFGVPCAESMIELFAVLLNTSSLKLSSSFLKSFTSKLQNGLGIVDCIKTPFQNLTHLELGTVFDDHEALVINNILYHSPCIEVLKITVDRSMHANAPTVGESSETEEVWSNFRLSHLKLVEINDFEAKVTQIRFIKFLLENALILEDLIIATARYLLYNNKSQLRIVGKELLLYPRASSTLVMQFG